MWLQRTIHFEPRPGGIHLVTGEVLAALPGLGNFGVGILTRGKDLVSRAGAIPSAP